jgi:hypothetical protein
MTFNRNGLNKPIQDLQNTYDTINVNVTNPLLSNVYFAKVRIDTVIHPNDDDLEFSLIHLGVNDTVIYHAGGAGDNFIGTVLNDSSQTPVAGGTAPFTGIFKPYLPLSQFNGQNPNGSWILKIYDRTTGNTGTLKAWSLILTLAGISGVNLLNNHIPEGFNLGQNYPNPFNPGSKFKVQIAKLSYVKVIVYDVIGKEIETLVNEQLKPGTYEVEFDGSKYSSGVYFYKMTTGSFTETKKMVLIK